MHSSSTPCLPTCTCWRWPSQSTENTTPRWSTGYKFSMCSSMMSPSITYKPSRTASPNSNTLLMISSVFTFGYSSTMLASFSTRARFRESSGSIWNVWCLTSLSLHLRLRIFSKTFSWFIGLHTLVKSIRRKPMVKWWCSSPKTCNYMVSWENYYVRWCPKWSSNSWRL